MSGVPRRVFATSTQPHRKCGRSRTMLSNFDQDLQNLIAKGKTEGRLTYEEVSAFLPDEIEGTDRIDAILAALDGLGIELIDSPNAHRRALAEQENVPAEGDRSFVLTEGMP